MAHQIHNNNDNLNNTNTTSTDDALHPSKMHAAKEKFIGGVKETIGTVAHAEGLKESGREQKREGDAEALAAGKGKKHYDPALARKGVGIQHKHLGPNPKKITEGPCAGCKDGTCQIGHDYDAAICHSVTQGHCDAGHVKNAGMPVRKADMHGDHIAHSAPCCNDYGVVGHNHGGVIGHNHGGVVGHKHEEHVLVLNKNKNKNSKKLVSKKDTAYCNTCNNASCRGCGAGVNPIMPGQHNIAYDAAACPGCTAGTCNIDGHSARDRERIKAMKHKRTAEEKALRKQNKAERRKHGNSGDNRYPTADFSRDLDNETKQDAQRVNELDREDQRDMNRLQGKLHNCNPAAHSGYTSRGIYTCDVCGQRLN